MTKKKWKTLCDNEITTIKTLLLILKKDKIKKKQKNIYKFQKNQKT